MQGLAWLLRGSERLRVAPAAWQVAMELAAVVIVSYSPHLLLLLLPLRCCSCCPLVVVCVYATAVQLVAVPHELGCVGVQAHLSTPAAWKQLRHGQASELPRLMLARHHHQGATSLLTTDAPARCLRWRQRHCHNRRHRAGRSRRSLVLRCHLGLAVSSWSHACAVLP